MQGASCEHQQHTISNKLDIYFNLQKLIDAFYQHVCNLLSIQQQCTNDTMERDQMVFW